MKQKVLFFFLRKITFLFTVKAEFSLGVYNANQNTGSVRFFKIKKLTLTKLINMGKKYLITKSAHYNYF